jgi:hypothetical protein
MDKAKISPRPEQHTTTLNANPHISTSNVKEFLLAKMLGDKPLLIKKF